MTLLPANPRTRFIVVALVALVAFFLIGIPLAGPIIAAMRPLTDALAQMLGLAVSVDAGPDGGWLVQTGLAVNGASGTATVTLSDDNLRYVLRGLPLLLALMAAPPWNRKLPMRLAIGVAVMLLAFVLAALAVINGHLASIINHRSDMVGLQAPAYTVSAEPYGPMAYFLSGFAYYVAMMFWPLAGPVLLWALLKPEALRLLLGRTPVPESAPAPLPDRGNP